MSPRWRQGRAVRKREAVAALTGQAEALGPAPMYIFGSTVQDDATSDSDIDRCIGYDRSSGFSLVELVGIKQMLEHHLGMSITSLASLDVTLR
jgi:predicted nucleotidyltransferase